jgi:hypothetical protein
LLFLHGQAAHGITSITKSYERFALLENKLDIRILLNDTAVPKPWHTAMLVPKLPQNATVVLNLSIRCEDTIVFTNYPITALVGLTRDSLYIINSDTDLLAITASIPFPIDFNNNTLLYMRGVYPNIIHKVDTVLLKNYCTNQYILNIKVYDRCLTQPQSWYVSIITPKMTRADIILYAEYENYYYKYYY